MNSQPQIVCIGAVLWDVIGRTAATMAVGHDVAGRITRVPGGVALNVAMALQRAGQATTLLSAVGQDPEGAALLDACAAMGLDVTHIHRDPQLATDQYMAIEGANGLVAAIADARSLEAAGDAILLPLTEGHFGLPFAGCVVLDGNLTEALLGRIAQGAEFATTDLRVAPASPGKVRRLFPLLKHPRLTLYINRIEVGLLYDQRFANAIDAARALCARGVARAVVTDGANPAALVSAAETVTGQPPQVSVQRITGAGDTLMASHIAAERRGLAGQAAFDTALHDTARYVSGETPL